MSLRYHANECTPRKQRHALDCDQYGAQVPFSRNVNTYVGHRNQYTHIITASPTIKPLVISKLRDIRLNAISRESKRLSDSSLGIDHHALENEFRLAQRASARDKGLRNADPFKMPGTGSALEL